MAEPSAANAAPSEDLSDPTALTPTKWRKYAEAKLGFRNHWYPIFFSEEIEEGKPVPIRCWASSYSLAALTAKSTR